MTTLKAGRELDALVAEKVMGWKAIGGDIDMWWDGKRARYSDDVKECREDHLGMDNHPGYWSPSTDIAAAWEVVEKMHPLELCLDGQRGCRYEATFCDGIDDEGNRLLRGEFIVELADTAPLAICLAALKATDSSASSPGLQSVPYNPSSNDPTRA